MKFYIKQKMFSWGDQFSVYNSREEVLYTVRGEVFSFGKKLHVYDSQGQEVAAINQKVWSWLHRYIVSENGREVVQVVKRFTLVKPQYDIEGLDWEVSGDFWGHEYDISCQNRPIAHISKKWLTWGDTYEVETFDQSNGLIELCIAIIIDAVCASDATAAAVAAS